MGPSLDQLDVTRMVARYGVVDQACIRARVGPDKSRLAMTKFCSRLVERNLLLRMNTNGRVFYRLAPEAKYLVQAPDRFYREPGPQTFEQLKAVLYYCCLGPRHLDRFTKEDCLDFCPDFPECEFGEAYYFDPGPKGEELGYLGLLKLVPLQKRPTEVASDTRTEIAKRSQLGEPFQRLLTSGRFLIVLMVHSNEQCRALRHVIAANDWTLIPGAPAVQVRVHVVPDIPRRRRKGASRG